MKTLIKKVTVDDKDIINKLIKIERDAFNDGGLNQWGLVPLINHGLVYVIVVDGQVIGVIEYLRDMQKPNTAYVFSLAIISNYRNQGFGSQLLDYSLSKIKKYGINRVELTLDPDNKGACYFYNNKFGFQKVGYRENEYGPEEDRLIMALKL